MNISLFILSYSIWPVYELELSLIQEKLDIKNKVILLHCKGDQAYCSANNFKFKNYNKINTLCKYCKNRYSNGIQWLENKKYLTHENYFFINQKQKEEIEVIKNILNSKKKINKFIEKKINKKNLDILNICKTTLAVKYQTLNINLNSYYNEIVPIIINCLKSYYSTINQINKYKPNEIFIFNGRDGYFQAAMRAAQNLMDKDKIFIYEFPDFGGFQGLKIVKGTNTSDIRETSKQIYQKYQNNKKNLSKDIVIKKAKKMLDDRYRQNFDSFIPWKANQKPGYLPQNFNKEKKNISIYTSSEFEIRYIPENEKFLNFINQLELIKEILDEFISINDVQFYLRLHPNQKKENDKYLNQLNHYNNLKIIQSESDVNSYDLGLNSTLNIVMHGTIGLEFIARGINTIIIGPTLYQDFIEDFIYYEKKNIKKKIKENIFNKKKIIKLITQENAMEALYAQEFFIYKTKFVKKNSTNNALMYRNKLYKNVDTNILLVFFVRIIYGFRKLFKYFNIYL